MTHPKTPLSFALPAYRRGEYQNHKRWLENLAALGFQWVTFIPTWLVHDEVPCRIDDEYGPSIEELAQAVRSFIEAGFHIKFEPHLDWIHTLGKPYEWRRRIYMPPDEEYLTRVLAPLFGILSEATESGATCAFSLGSELAVSLAEFAPRWESVMEALRREYPDVRIGHNIDSDSLQPGTEIRKPWNDERARRALPTLTAFQHRHKLRAVQHYLAQLDYVGFSFYPNVKAGRSLAWWREQTTARKVLIVARAFLKEAQTLVSRLRRAAGERPQFTIGEFGIGCTDPTRPYHTDAASFLQDSEHLDPGAIELRRKYHLGFLECLRKAPHLYGPMPATYWTVTHYDFLGVLEQPGYELWRDPVLVEAVREYNRKR